MHDNLPVEYSFQFSTTMTTLVKIKLEQKERRVEMPLFPDSYSLCVESLSNPGIVKGFVTKRLLTWHVTKQSYVNC
jgi:hypothetical protein